MRIISEIESQGLEMADLLSAGQTIIYPTETSYGLGCDATNQEAVDKIFKIKERDPQKPLLVIVSSLDQIRPYIIWDERLEKIQQKYWPGPLTVLCPAQPQTNLASGVVSQDHWLAFRISSHPVARALVEVLGKPVVSTSANKAGEKALYSPLAIIETFSHSLAKPDLVINSGDLPETPASTIVKLTTTGFEIIRQGQINFSM